MSYHSLRTLREAITEIVRHAPPEVRPAIIALIRAAFRSLKRGYQPDVRAVPLRSWRSLLQLLSSIAAMQSETETLLRVSNDLLSMADHMAPPLEVLRQSAEILVHALHADLYVCRLRNPQGEWVVQAAARRDGGGIPLVVPALEEGIRNHPVMRTVKEGSARHVVSNNLRGIERGGESFDCVVYKAGYRSRLAFVLRERNDRPPFGLVLLYTQREYGFEMYDAHFLSKCARIVSPDHGPPPGRGPRHPGKSRRRHGPLRQQRPEHHAQPGRILRRAGGRHRQQPFPRPAPFPRAARRVPRGFARPAPGPGLEKILARADLRSWPGTWAACWKAPAA